MTEQNDNLAEILAATEAPIPVVQEAIASTKLDGETQVINERQPTETELKYIHEQSGKDELSSKVVKEVTEAPVDAILEKLLSRIAPPSSISPYLKMLVFSAPGAGKTYLSAQAPKPLVIDVDKGAVTIIGKPWAKDVQVMEFKSLTQIETLVKYLKEGHKAFDRYETIVIDTLSEIHKRGLTEVAIREGHGLKPEGSDHQENNERVRRLISDLRDMDRHFIANCHTKRIESQMTGIQTFMPDFSERLVNTCNAVFDIIGYMFRETQMDGSVLRQMRVQASGGYEVKTRIDTLPDVVVNPSWDKLYGAYQQYRENAQQ